jgi:dienelactone hydrolase
MESSFTRRRALQTLTSLGALAVSMGARSRPATGSAVLPAAQAGGVPADQSKRWKGSALGNLYPFIKEEQQRTRQRLAFLNRRPKDLEAWKTECRQKVFQALAYRPEPCQPEAKILERVDQGEYIRERLTFHTAPNVTVPAYLLVPKRAKFPVPAVLALHDHSGFYYWGKEHIIETENEHPMLTAFRQRRYDGVCYPATLARHGYVVLAIDMFYFGDRRLILDEDLERGINDQSKTEAEGTINQINDRNGKAEHVIYKNMIDAGITWAGVLAWDDIRSIDYLVTRPEVDPRRIACTGLSVGGFRTNFLAGLDPRIKAACVAGWMTSFRYLLPRYESYTVPAGWPPGLLGDLDYPDVGSLTLPNPLMVVHGWQDTLFPPEGVRAAFSSLVQCYEAIGKPERFRTVTFDGPHKFPLEAQQRMMEWFDRWV